MAKIYNGILKNQNKDEKTFIHPQTNARQVLTGANNEKVLQDELNTINDKLISLVQNDKNKGSYSTYNDLITAFPNGIENPDERNGWTAHIESEDSIYYWDIAEKEWKKSIGQNICSTF